jgi:hypothetical protein
MTFQKSGPVSIRRWRGEKTGRWKKSKKPGNSYIKLSTEMNPGKYNFNSFLSDQNYYGIAQLVPWQSMSWMSRVWVTAEARFFHSAYCPDRCWNPPSLLLNGYRGQFPPGWSSRDTKLTTHLRVTLRSREVKLYLYSPTCLHGTVHRTTLPFFAFMSKLFHWHSEW